MLATVPLRNGILALIGLFYLTSIWVLWKRVTKEPIALSFDCSRKGVHPAIVPSVSAQKFRRVTVASSFGFHHDVYMAVTWTLDRVFKTTDMAGSVNVFAPQPFGYGFGDVVEKLGLFNGTIHDPEELVSFVSKGEMDMLILGTCEIDLRGDWNQELLGAWDARPANNKFQLVCIVHNVGDTTWQPAITSWASRDAIRLLTISEHVKTGFKYLFDEHADSKVPELQKAGYENIPIDVHVPVLDVDPFVDPSPRSSDVLSSAVIQGSFDTNRRDYLQIFQELSENLREHPRVWGYLPLGDEKVYIVDPTSPHPPFHLYLVGSGSLQVPAELENVVSLHTGLEYPEFYRLMSKMDICLPAFAENGYYEQQASSTFAMAIECDVPILVTQRMQRAYTYADNSVTVVRPAILREMAAIKALRTRNATNPLGHEYYSEGLKGANKKVLGDMLSRGWYRTYHEHREEKETIWQENNWVVEKLLRGLV